MAVVEVVVIETAVVIPEHSLAKAAIAERMDSEAMGILVVPIRMAVAVVVLVMLDMRQVAVLDIMAATVEKVN
jgi:hypothetical protein